MGTVHSYMHSMHVQHMDTHLLIKTQDSMECTFFSGLLYAAIAHMYTPTVSHSIHRIFHLSRLRCIHFLTDSHKAFAIYKYVVSCIQELTFPWCTAFCTRCTRVSHLHHSKLLPCTSLKEHCCMYSYIQYIITYMHSGP